jgi:hypothetical protein
MSLLSRIKEKFTTASEAVEQKLCDHHWVFMHKNPAKHKDGGEQAIKFEHHYKCSKCGLEKVTEEPIR